MFLGLLLSPTLSFACGKKGADQHKETSAKDCSKDCCKEKKHSLPCGENDKDCDGKCGQASCHCPSFSGNAFMLAPAIQYKHESIEYPDEKPTFVYTETFFKSVIDSLRLPPKIS